MLTTTQEKVLGYVTRYARKHKRGPTLEQLCEMNGTSSVGSMFKHIAALEDKGFIERRDGHGSILPKTRCPCCGQKVRT